MTVLTVYVVLLIGNSSLSIWKLLADSDEKTLVKRLLSANCIPPETYYAKWFPVARQALADGDEQKLSKYLGLIKSLAQAFPKESASILQAQAGNIFPFACERLGFVDAFKKILLLNDWGFRDLDYRATATNYIDQIRFCPDSALFTYRIASTVDDIFERMELTDEEKSYYAYHFYSAIEENTVINGVVRRDTIGDIFKRLCLLYVGGTGELREKTLLYVVCNILKKEDVSDRQMQWGLLIEKLYQHHFSHDRCYIAVIAQMFRALFFYCFFEIDTLREEYRNGLQGLCTFSHAGKDRISPSLSRLVLEKHRELIEWFAADLKEEHPRISMFDYFPENGDGKTVVWDVEHCTRFAFWFYLLVGYRTGYFPYVLPSESKDIRELDGAVYATIVLSFEGEGELTSYSNEMIRNMQALLGVKHSLAETLAKWNFSYFNQAYADFQKMKAEARMANISENIDELNAAFEKQLRKMDGIQYSRDVPLDKAEKIAIEPRISQGVMYGEENMAFYLHDVVQWSLNAIIKEELRPVKLWFGKESVCRLYDLLSRGAYKYTNYRYTDDMGFHQDVRESDEFKRLKALLEKLDVISDGNMWHRVFLRQPIRFNAQVVEYALREPTDVQCENFIDSYKIADGKYRIDGVLYKLEYTINYKDGTETITFEDASKALAEQESGSDMESSGVPQRQAPGSTDPGAFLRAARGTGPFGRPAQQVSVPG